MGQPDPGTEGEPERREGRSGRIPPEGVLEVFEARDDRARPLTADDIMEALDCSRRTAHNKLNELVDRGLLETRKIGARGRVWWVPIEDASDGAAQSRPQAVENAVEDVELPGSGVLVDERREAVLAAYDYLRENPRAKKADFQRDIYPEHRAGYESADGWWNAIQPALKQLPGIDPPAEREHLWHYLGG